MHTADDAANRHVQRSELGLAIGARAEEVYARTIALLYRNQPSTRASETYLDYRRGRSVIGTLLIARWLVSDIAADKEELEYITRSGAAAAREGVPLVETTRGHHHWRRTLVDVAREEAARLGTADEVLSEVIRVINDNADASLVRIANAYDTQLRQTNAQLERASQFKSDFLAKMSHQLRTPLTAIIGFCEVLLGSMDGGLNAEQMEDVTQIHKSGIVLLELVNEILDLSKIEAGRLEIEIEDVDLQNVVDDVIATMLQIAESKALKLTSKLSPAAHVVMADPGRLREILTNLVSNAIKFTSSGSVTITSARLDGVAEISVTDTGIGIAAEARERIFEEFRQANDQIARNYGGTGLGLSIARKLAELQGGRMGVESQPGKGSRFWFTLPMGKESAPAAPA
ncbi:MAG TPA: ATP-binding protein [Candidatus Dormibacteraeota bacterium]|nr:ATP-binding protein [Candidatus Dormibacteraeota bacterium]